VTADEKKYLENKHKGGISNSKGASYELYYIVREIMRFLVQYKDNHSSVSLTAQKEYVYVDDLVEYEPDLVTYCQLKNVEGLRWINGNKTHTITEDFECQSKMCMEKGEMYRLRLVYSDSEFAVSNVPGTLVSYTSTEFFDNYDSIEQMVLSERNLVDSFKQTYPQFDSLDKVSNYAVAVCGIWAGCNRSNNNVNLQEIINEVNKCGSGFTMLQNNVALPMNIIAILNDIIGLKYDVSANILRMSYNGFMSEMPVTDDLLQKISDSNPKDIFELIQILY